MEHLSVGLQAAGYWYSLTMFAVLFMFLVIDVQTKRNQRKYLWRAQLIHAKLNSIEKQDEANTDLRNSFRTFDPAGANSIYMQSPPSNSKRNYEQFTGYKRSFLDSKGLKYFYGGLFVVTFLGVYLFLNLPESTQPKCELQQSQQNCGTPNKKIQPMQ